MCHTGNYQNNGQLSYKKKAKARSRVGLGSQGSKVNWGRGSGGHVDLNFPDAQVCSLGRARTRGSTAGGYTCRSQSIKRRDSSCLQAETRMIEQNNATQKIKTGAGLWLASVSLLTTGLVCWRIAHRLDAFCARRCLILCRSASSSWYWACRSFVASPPGGPCLHFMISSVK